MTGPFERAPDLPDVLSIKESIRRHIRYSIGKSERTATALDRYQALALSIRDLMVDRWMRTQSNYYERKVKRVYYLSLEFLMGRTLKNSLMNLGLYEEYKEALGDLGEDLDEIEELESDAALGNGGLGRLAACFLDSMATLGVPGYGYGLRYDYGIFRQQIDNGWQVEEPDDWLRLPNPWEMQRPEYLLTVKFGGHVEHYVDASGVDRSRWVDTHDVLAQAFDTPIPGYGGHTVNTLRLWQAQAAREFDFEDFNAGDYIGSVEHMVLSRTITRVLYPNDNIYMGRELRLKQQYFMVSASLQDAIRRHLVDHSSLDNLPGNAVFQLNDTHPALAVPEMMRLLIDHYGYRWKKAWEVTQGCMAYTNHTLLPEALETWPMDLIERLLPRHVQIINRINHEFLDRVRERFPDDEDIIQRVSIYGESGSKRVRMAHLASVGSSSINGVAALHTELLKTRVLGDFHRLFPDRFNNKTNGVTQRRWLLASNPPLANLITETIGDGWITNLSALTALSEHRHDAAFQDKFAATKRAAKVRLSNQLSWQHDMDLDPDWVIDIQIKRIHEYKRQLLNALHIIHLYKELERDPDFISNPRVFLFAGKAAPGYAVAKLVIKLINDIAHRVNNHPEVSKKLRLHFVPDYSVSKAEILIPAANVSEQISTAGFEASGTGNMKFMLNGALTVGTLDGANVEMLAEVGEDNFFLFGLNVAEVTELRERGYHPRELYEADGHIKEVVELLEQNHFNRQQPGLYQPLVDALLGSDYYLHFADFDPYRRAHLQIDEAYSDRNRWLSMSIENTARAGKFSSDRTIRDYAADIWKVPVKRG